MSKPRHLIHNLQEAVESDDINNRQSLHHAALLALGAAVLQGDSAVYGVVQGLTVSCNGADLNVTVATGLGLRGGVAASSYDSAVAWIEQATASTFSIAAHVAPANPRWVVIEIAEDMEAEAQEARQIFNTVTKRFDATNVDKVIRPAPVITSRAGTAAANPIFPAGIAGVIPLAYVYLGAGATAINATDIVMCRPMLRGDAGQDVASVRDVWGGGVSVAAAGLALSLRNAGGRMPNARARWGLGAAAGTNAFTLTAQGMDGAALPVADDVVYFYAAPAPYPSGYDSNLAVREFRPGTNALTRFQGMVCAGLYNAVVVGSTVEPQIDAPTGAPTAGSFTMTCAPFAAGATIDRTTAVYLGAASWDVSAGDLLVQTVIGDIVTPSDETTTGNIVTGGAAAYNIWGVGGTLTLFPVTARHVHTQVSLSDNDTSDTTGVAVSITDGTGVTWRWAGSQANVIGSWSSSYFAILSPDNTGTVTVATVTGAAFDDVRLRGAAYKDAILANR